MIHEMEAMLLKNRLEDQYHCWNRRYHARTDPVSFLYPAKNPADREIIAFIAAALAYGRLASIRKSIAAALGLITESPARFFAAADVNDLQSRFTRFRHRFAGPRQMGGLTAALKGVLDAYGSLEACFSNGIQSSDPNIWPALDRFVARIRSFSPEDPGHLLPLPHRGSACKRLHLFLRWMIRKDAVDPGGWGAVDPAALVVPVDVHMHRTAVSLGFTNRKTISRRTADEITSAFARISPADPVRYDFALTCSAIVHSNIKGAVSDIH